MGKIVCKRCPNSECGIYNDLSVDICECGTDLRQVPGVLVDIPVLPELAGEINETLPVFVQKCSYCGTENYILDPAKPAKVCHNCHRPRIASVVPSPFLLEERKREQDTGTQILGHNHAPEILVQKTDAGFFDDDDDDDDEFLTWANIMQLPEDEHKPGPSKQDSDATTRKAQAVTKPAHSTLTLTALCYGNLSVTLTEGKDRLPYLLGRSANQAQFLGQDLRVGNEHCELGFRNGSWYVHEIRAQNGTAVNRWEFLDIGGERILHDGDELILGHHSDSMAFRITIR